MTKTRFMTMAALLVLAAGFAWGMIHLFQLRFEGGDIYPPYSSLRADPLGVEVFYEGLQSIPEMTVGRFYQTSAKLTGNRRRALFLFGVDKDELRLTPEPDFKALQTFLYNGGRVVITFLPAGTEQKTWTPHAPTNDLAEAAKTVSMLDKFGFGVEDDTLFIPNTTAKWAGSNTPPAELPTSLSWHSADYFRDMDTNWYTLYQRGNHPVIVERAFGPGSLVLSSDSYYVSNEAVRRERHPALLAWLVGGRREVLFDETHLGVEEHPSVGTLLRQYHLGGLLAGLLLVAGLFVWQSSVPLLPPLPDEPEGRAALVQGQDASAGFASLLRRSIPPSEILSVCFAEWKSGCAQNPRAAARLAAIEKIVETEQSLAPGARRPVEAWQDIQRILTERK